jgi:glutamate N-acetyltransferase/amino-acid N-acetyltransferase
LLVNSGNANAGTGAPGLTAALACCQAVAAQGDASANQVLPFSTGVIGEPLPVAKITAALPDAYANLAADHWAQAARAIMTTDTAPKAHSRTFYLGDTAVHLTGIAKGAGMIHPNMATLLAFIATDAALSPALLQAALQQAVADSFNAISIDGDTSTNDACVLIATGQATQPALTQLTAPEYALFCEELNALCLALAQLIVRDGEGATKFVTVVVEAAQTREEARQVAFTIAHSPLVKTALFASDPNWGRILAAVGRAGIPGLDVSQVALYLGDVCIVRAGARAEEYQESLGLAVMQAAEISVRVVLGRGTCQARVWTCDFSYDYVKINAEYRT